MNGDGVQKIIAAAQAALVGEVVKVAEDDRYSTRPLTLIPAAPEPGPAALVVHTLSGLVDYIKANVDNVDLKASILHVDHEGYVGLYSNLIGRAKVRHAYVAAVRGGDMFDFGEFCDLESFNISLQTMFEDGDDRAAVLSLVGNVREEGVKSTEDDGITQSVTARKGISLVAEVKVPNPVTLRPYRTFREIAQPASKFVLRLRGRDGSLPEAALFEADGGAWKLEAINSIASYLKDALKETVSIIA